MWETERIAYDERVTRQTEIIVKNVGFLISEANVNGVANNDSTAMTKRTEAINATNAALVEWGTIDRELKTKLNTALTEQTAFVATSETLRSQIQEIDTELQKKRELEGIRKEQAESLHTKYAGNLHSSWLGLWTPLSDETRVAILVITLALFACAVAIVVFLIVGKHITLPAKPAFMGGFRLKTRTLAH